MKVHEKLNDLVPGINITYLDMPKGLTGLTVRNNIYLSKSLTNYYHQTEVLAEEVAHYLTSDGDISDYRNINSMQQEVKARRYAHQLLVPLNKLIECYELGIWGDIYEICLHLEIDRSYFNRVIEDYKTQFGTCVRHGNYLITFCPQLKIETL